jgi:hypothetical protein
MSEIPEVQGSQPPTPPSQPQADLAKAREGLSAAWFVVGCLDIAANQTIPIQQLIYFMKVMKSLQGVMGQLSSALLALRNDPSKATFDKLMQVFKTLKQLKGEKPAYWGGAFGATAGKSIYNAVQRMYNDIYKSLGNVPNPDPESKTSWWQEALKNGGNLSNWIPGSAEQMWKGIAAQEKLGEDPFSSVQGALSTSIDSFNDLSAVQQAQMTNLNNHMGLALQQASKSIAKVWQVLLQMISYIQQG